MPIRVVAADDHQIMREGLKMLISDEPDLLLVGEASTGRQALAMAGELTPDVVVMDIGMPEMDGVEATAKIVAAHPLVKVIALSMHADPYYINSMKRAGASGYILKENAFYSLADAIRKVVAGEEAFPV
jgi:DNA-binding NarL/FixJ family response regulator